MRLVEFVLAEDAMENSVAVIHVYNAFNIVQNWRNERNMRSKENCIVRHNSSEATRDEEK